MDSAIKRFRARRAKRLAQIRTDKEDVEWITVRGQHVPLDPDTKKAVGGYYSGKVFSKVQDTSGALSGAFGEMTIKEKWEYVKKRSAEFEAIHKNADERSKKYRRDLVDVKYELSDIVTPDVFSSLQSRDYEQLQEQKEYFSEEAEWQREQLKKTKSKRKAFDINNQLYRQQMFALSCERELAKRDGRDWKKIDREMRSMHEERLKELSARKDDLEAKIDSIEKEKRAAILEKVPSVESCTCKRDFDEYITANDYFQDTYRFNIPRPNMKMMVGHMETFFNRYPGLKGKMQSITSGECKDDCFAFCHSGTTNITLNTTYFNDAEKLERVYRKSVETGFNTKYDDPMKGILYHELGHAVEGLLLDGGECGPLGIQIKGEVKKKFGLSESDIEKEVSGYAMKSSAEFLAEALGEYWCNAKPRRVAQYVGERIEQEMRVKGFM